MKRDVAQDGTTRICTFRHENCNEPAVGEIPITEGAELMVNGKRSGEARAYDTIYVCSGCYDDASITGYFVQRFDEDEKVASSRFRRIIGDRHFDLRGEFFHEKRPVRDLVPA